MRLRETSDLYESLGKRDTEVVETLKANLFRDCLTQTIRRGLRELLRKTAQTNKLMNELSV